MTYEEVMMGIISLDFLDQIKVLKTLSYCIYEGAESVTNELNHKNASIRLALKINKNEAVANLLEEDE